MCSRRKGSENEITAWSPKPRTPIDEAKALHPEAPRMISQPFVYGKSGAPVAERAYKTA